MTEPATSSLPPDPIVGALLHGRYRILRRIGEGGVGTVYEGRHEALGRLVAVKVLTRAWGDDEQAVKRFEREARAASGLGHRAIVDVYDFGCLADGRPYLVMELLSGQELADVLEQESPFELDRALPILGEMAAALDLVHARGIVHRDVKPENVFLAREADDRIQPKLLDFGLARTVLDGRRLTQEGMFFGTPEYLAPETTYAAELDGRADVYSLATVAFEMLTGRLPFEDDNPWRLVTTKTSSSAPTMGAVCGSSFPQALEEAIARGLARDPDQRFASAADLVSALAAAGCEGSGATGRSSSLPEATERIRTGDGRPQGQRLELGLDGEEREWRHSGTVRRERPTPPADVPVPAHRGRRRTRLVAVAGFGALLAGATGGLWLTLAEPRLPTWRPAGPPASGAVPTNALAPPSPSEAEPSAAESTRRSPGSSVSGGRDPSETSAGSSVSGGRDPSETSAGSPRVPGRTEERGASSASGSPGSGSSESGHPAATPRETSGTSEERPDGRGPAEPARAGTAEAATASPTEREAGAGLRKAPGEPRHDGRRAERARSAAGTPSGTTEPQDAADGEALASRAYVVMAKGRLPEAVGLFRRATNLAPRTARAWRGLGLAHENLDHRREAVEAYRRYLQLAPKASDAAEVRRRLSLLGASEP
jgi:serine/threonine-protein kinase